MTDFPAQAPVSDRQARKISKEIIRQHVQDQLLYFAATAFTDAEETKESEEVKAELRRQYERIEALFGYKKGSTSWPNF